GRCWCRCSSSSCGSASPPPSSPERPRPPSRRSWPRSRARAAWRCSDEPARDRGAPRVSRGAASVGGCGGPARGPPHADMSPDVPPPAVMVGALLPVLIVLAAAAVVLVLDVLPPRDSKSHLGGVALAGVVA